MNYRILIAAVIVTVILYLFGGLTLDINQAKVFNLGTVLMVLGAAINFFSGKIVKLMGISKANSNVYVKLSGLGIVILGLITLTTTIN